MKHYKAYLNEFYQLSGCGWSVDIMKQIKRLKRRINRLKPLNDYQALDKMRLLDNITRLLDKLDPSKL